MATIKDIARLAGVSHGTVSNVINGNGNVSSAKILAVQKAAQELGYAMNARAKSLREGRSTTLAVVLPNIIDPPYAEFYTSFQHSAKKSGFKTSLYLSDNSFEKEKELIARIRSSTPYGIAAVTTYNGDEDVYAAAGFSPDEVLYISHCPTPQCSYIGFDYEACGHALGREACKYSCVALVTDDARLTAQRDCINGFLAETEGRCRVQHYQKTGTERSAAIAMDIFSAYPPPEAVFVTSYGVAQTVRGVMNSFFNAPNTQIYAITPLCTLPEEDFIKYELNFRQLGNEAAQLLLEMVGQDLHAQRRTLPNDGFRTWLPRISVTQQDCKRLTIMTLDSPTAHTMQNMSRLYTKVTGTEVQVNIFSYDSVHELLSSLNAANAFDIIRLDATWQNWFAAKIFEPLDQIDPGVRDQVGTFVSGISSCYGEMSGHLYAFPETPSSQMLFYRQDLFSSSVMQRLYKETYRAELRPPETFEEYNRIASFFTRRLNPSSPVNFGSTLTLGNTGVAATEFLARYFSLTDHLFDPEDHILLTSEEAVRALELLVAVRQYAPPTYCNWWRDTSRLFAQGDVAMTVLFSNYASEMLDRDSKVHTRIGYAMVPGRNPLLGGGSIGVCKYSHHKQEALNFIRWFCSEEVSSATTLMGSVSPCRKTYNNYQVIDTYPWLSIAVDSFAASHTHRWPSRMEGGFDERSFLSILGVNVMQAINGLLTPRQALENAQATFCK